MDRFQKTNLSAFVNFLQAKYEAFTGATRVEARPYYAMVDPSDLCQLRCPTCPTGIENAGRVGADPDDTTYRTDRGLMTPALFDALLDELGEHLFLLELHSWGEPLLNRELPAFVRRAKAFDVEVHTHTHLSMPLSDERIEALVACGLDMLFASIDGFSQEAYQRFRVGGDVELAKRNLERLARARDRLGATTVLVYKFLMFSWNEHELAPAQRFAEERGIRFQPQDASVGDAAWLPSHRRGERPFLTADDVAALDQRWAAAGRPDYWKRHDRHPFWMPVAPGNRWIPTAGPQPDTYCSWHYSTAVIQPQGHVAPCCITPKTEDRFGQVVPGRTRLDDVWNGDAYRSSRAAFAGAATEVAADTVCTRCYFPDALKHVYNLNDGKVLAQYATVFGDSRPELTWAFELLARGDTPPDRERFVEFARRHLQRYFSAA